MQTNEKAMNRNLWWGCKFFLAMLLLMASHGAKAECVVNGEIYPEGAEVSGYTCENGKWVERS